MAANRTSQNAVNARRFAGNGAVSSRPVRGGVQYANPYTVRYNAGQARSPQGGRRPAAQRPPVPVKKNRRKERDYFFIMRRGVCFVIMLLALVWIAVFALNYLNILPQYTSFLVKPDLTAMDLREDVDTGEVDENGDAILEVYKDKSEYLGFIDPIFGVLKKVAGIGATGEDEESKSPFYDAILGRLEAGIVDGEQTEGEETEGEETEGEVTEGDQAETAKISPVAEAAEEEAEGETTEGTEGEGAEGEGTEGEETEGEEEVTVPVITVDVTQLPVINEEAIAQDGMYKIATLAFTYFPILLAVGAVMALIIFLLAFFSLFGRRIFKGFGIMALVMLLGGVAAVLAGLAVSGTYEGNPVVAEDGVVTSILDLSKLVAFLTQVLSGAPATTPDPEVDVMPLTIVGGYGLLIVLIIPAVILILSIFARKKVPYSIFDK